MALPMNEQKNRRDARSRGMVQRIHLIPLLHEPEPQFGIIGIDEPAFWFDNFPTITLPVASLLIDLGEAITQSDLPHVSVSGLSRAPGTGDDLSDIQEVDTSSFSTVSTASSATVPDGKALEAGGFASQIRRLVKSSGLYALSSMASPLVTLILAPILTHNLTRTDYGALAVLNTTVALTAGVTQFGLGSAFFRSYNYDYESPTDRSGVIFTVILLLSLLSIPVVLAMMLAAPWLASLLLNSPSFSVPLKLAGLVILLQNLTVPGFAWLRAENRASFFSILSIVNLLITLGVTVLLVGVVHMGIAGSFIATGMGYGAIVVCTLPLLLLRSGIHLRFDIARGLLSFGFPNAANVVSAWILQLSDRYLLSHLTSLAQTASYTVAYSLGGVISAVVIAPFSLAWPTSMYAIAKKDNAAAIFQQVFRWFSLVLLLATFGLSLIAMLILNIFFPVAYHSAAPIIPIITASLMFYGIYTFFIVGVSIRRKIWLAVIFTAIAALTNVGLNLVLIPLYGSMGAAISTLLAYAVLALIAYFVNQRLYPIPFELGRFAIALAVGVLIFVANERLGNHIGTVGTWGLSLFASLVYGGFLLLLGRLPAKAMKKTHHRS